MEYESKKKRFLNFIDQTIIESCNNVSKRIFESSCEYPLTLKLRIRDVGLVKYITFANNSYTVSETSTMKVDCLMIFNKAKTLHNILIGKVLPYNLDLIGKSDITFFNEKGKILTSIYIPAKTNYCKIIKGTRFTLKSEEQTKIKK